MFGLVVFIVLLRVVVTGVYVGLAICCCEIDFEFDDWW